MSQLDFIGRLEASEFTPGIHVVTGHGPLDERVAGAFADLLIPLAAADGSLVLDLEDAHGFDEAALAVVGRAAHLATCRGDRLAVVATSDHIRSMIQDCGLDDIVDLCSSFEEAIPHV